MTGLAPAVAGPTPGGAPRVDEAMRQRAAALLQHTHRWLENAAPLAPPVTAAVPALVSATGLYEARQYEACVRLVLDVIAALQRLCWGCPTLPPL